MPTPTATARADEGRTTKDARATNRHRRNNGLTGTRTGTMAVRFVQLSRQQRWLLLSCVAIALALCIAAIAVEAKPAAGSPSTANSRTSGSSSNSAQADAEKARVIRERAQERDRKIAEKKAKKEAAAAAAAKAQQSAAQEKEKATAATAKKQAEAAAAKAKADAAAQSAKAAEASKAAASKAQKEKKTEPAPAPAAASTADYARAAAEVKRAAAEAAAAAAPAKAAPRQTPAEIERAERARLATEQRRRTSLEKARKRNAVTAARRRDRQARARDRRAKRRAAEDARMRKRAEASRPEIVARGVEKLKWLQSASARATGSASRVIDINYNNFKKYVHASPRPYWLFVAFTALGREYSCQICRAVEPEIKKLAKIYYDDRKSKQQANGSSVVAAAPFSSSVDGPLWDAATRSGMPVFFVQVEIEANREVFRALAMQSAPTMVMLPPTAAAAPGPLPALLTSLPARYKFVLMRADPTVSDLNDFIQKVTGAPSVSLSTPREPGLKGLVQLVTNVLNLMDPVRFLLLCVAVVMLCLLAVLWSMQWGWRAWTRRSARKQRAAGIVSRAPSVSDLAPLRVFSQYSLDLSANAVGTPSLTRSSGGVAPSSAQQKPRSLGLFRAWFMCAACLVYLFGISGSMYTILRNGGNVFPPQFWRESWTQRLSVWKYIREGDSHDQSALEGLALGLLQLALASILILLNRTAFVAREVAPPGTVRSHADRARSLARWLWGLLYSPLLWGLLFFLTWRLIIQIYSKKNGGYRMGFVWKHFQPHHFKFIDLYFQKALKYLPTAIARSITMMVAKIF